MTTNRPRTRTLRRAAALMTTAAMAVGLAATAVPATAAPIVSLMPQAPVLRDAENLDRSPVAVVTDGGVYVGWRMLGLDPDGIAFNVYRDGVQVNHAPISTSTNFLDAGGSEASSYQIQYVAAGITGWATESFGVWGQQYLDVPLDKPADDVTKDGQPYTYRAGDASVGDLNGDGQLDIVLMWTPSISKDNSQSGYTGIVYIDAYEMDGTRLWRIDLGPNIRAGAHYTQMVVFDLDSDGTSEVVVKTADGTVDNAGAVIGDATADWRNANGYILDGPEYLTVFNGQTGNAVDTIDYVPPRGLVTDWGDGYGNRVDRFLAGVAYLDGEHPSAIFSRGYYTRAVIGAFDFDGTNLTQRWVFDSNDPGNESYMGQGNHNLSVADVDGDSRDEIIFGSATIDDNGQGLYNTGLGHGDALHVSDFVLDNPGLEVFAVHESMSASGSRGATMRDAETGQVLWSIPATKDTGRGAAADIDPRYPGAEGWAVGSDQWNDPSGYLMSADGERIASAIPAANFVVQWDADPLYEIADHTFETVNRTGVPTVYKWDYENAQQVPLFQPEGVLTNNDTKGTPSLQADLFGDWREELMYRTTDSTALRIFTTTDVTDLRLRTLMSDPVYRLAVAWQNVAYNQPPHTSYFLGADMQMPPAPNIRYVGDGSPDLVAPALQTHFDEAKRTLTISAADGTSGVASIQWRIGNGAWQTYTGPISAPKATTISYRAVDVAGNVTGEWKQSIPAAKKGAVDLAITVQLQCVDGTVHLGVNARNGEAWQASIHTVTPWGDVTDSAVAAGDLAANTFDSELAATPARTVKVTGTATVDGVRSATDYAVPIAAMTCG